MKNKVKLIVATLAVGMAVTLAACDGCGGCMGCGGKTTSSTLTRSNWFTGTSYNGIQPSFVEGHENFSKEKMTYEVTYDKSGASNAYLAVDYDSGVFTTEFYATKWNWAGTDKIHIPEGYAPEKAVEETVYYYRTELTISVQYTLLRGAGSTSEKFNDHVITESYFRAAGKNLQPVYSKQVIKSTSPANYQPKTLEDAYKQIDVSYENFYDYGGTRILSYTVENGESGSKEFKNLNKLEKTLFDNSSLYVAVRAMKLSSSLSESVSLFSAAAGGIDDYAIVGSEASVTKDESKVEDVLQGYTSKLAESGLYEGNGNVPVTAVTVSYAGGNLHGTTQTIWYASITDNDYNVSRATMLQLSIPISFSLGTLNYSLKSVDSTLWNG